MARLRTSADAHEKVVMGTENWLIAFAGSAMAACWRWGAAAQGLPPRGAASSFGYEKARQRKPARKRARPEQAANRDVDRPPPPTRSFVCD